MYTTTLSLTPHPCPRRMKASGDREASVRMGDKVLASGGDAHRYYREADTPRGHFYLGWCYDFGKCGVERDFHMAKRHYEVAGGWAGEVRAKRGAKRRPTTSRTSPSSRLGSLVANAVLMS